MSLVETRFSLCRKKMYRSRLATWGRVKKNREKDMRVAARKLKHGDSRGKGPVIIIRGKVKTVDDVARYWKRKGESIESVATGRQLSSTPEAVHFGAPGPTFVTPPPIFANPEFILRSLRDYHLGSFQSGRWIPPTKPSGRCLSTKSQDDVMLLASLMRDQSFRACKLYANGDFCEAKQALVLAIAKMKQVITADDPVTLLCIFVLILHVCREKRHDIASAVVKSFSIEGAEIFDSNHPLYNISRWLSSADPSQLDEIVATALACMGDLFEEEVGPLSASTLYTRMEYIVRVVRHRNLEQGGSALAELLRECEDNLGMHEPRTIQIRLALAFHFLRMRKYREALAIGRFVVNHLHLVPSISATTYLDVESLYISSHCWQELQEVDVGVDDFPGAEETRCFLFGLEGWLIEWFQPQSSAQIVDRKRSLLSIQYGK